MADIDTTYLNRARDFLNTYAANSGLDPKLLLERGRVVATCECDYKHCTGFQVANPDVLRPWDAVIITAENY